MKISFSFKPDSKVTLAASGASETIDLWGRAHKVLEGHAGRVNVYDQPLSAPSAGQAVTRSDGKTTLNLLKETGPAEVSVVLGKDRKGLVRMAARVQKRGFASGEHYWLAQDSSGRFKPEPGLRHRKIYVSASPAAMDVIAIAAHAKVSASVVNGAWLVARPQYGGSEAMPVTEAVRELITATLWNANADPRSDWVLYERGYSYTPSYSYPPFYWRGESELHPLVFGAWGTGARPFVTRGFEWIQIGPRFLLVRDLQIKMFKPVQGYGVIFENLRMTNNKDSQFSAMSMGTMKEVAFYDIVPSAPKKANATIWDGSEDRIGGFYSSFGTNLMFDGCLCDRNGWAEGYDFNRSVNFPYPPSDRNHGIYLQFDCRDIHIRDSMISRNASCGLQIRAGGQYERNLFTDNNLAVGLHSGSGQGMVNQFTNFLDNVNFGAGYKRVNGYQGAINRGYDVTGGLTAQIGCITAHVADPDNPAEIANRKQNPDRPDWDGEYPYNTNTIYIDNDIQVFAWKKDRNGNLLNERVDGLDSTTLMQTTIQRYTAQLLDQPKATINDLVEYLRDDTENSIGKTVRDAVQWTKTRFGRPMPARTTPANMVFRPDPRVDGFRADNRYNWSTLDLPGTHIADMIDLDGHYVMFGTMDRSVAAMTSRGGRLDVTSGKLAVGSLADAADVTVRHSGQFWCGTTDKDLKVKADSGRVALTGAVSSLDLEARGRAEVLLGPDATIPAGRKLVVSGQRTLVGWDGTGSATLTVAGTLEFRAGMTLTVGGTPQKQHYMRVGRRVETPNFSGTIADYEDRSATGSRMVFTEVSGVPVPGESFVFGVAENVSDSSDVSTDLFATVTSVLSRGFAPLRRFRSGALGDGVTEPTVAVSVVLAAGSTVAVAGHEHLSAGTYDLTGPGVLVADQGAFLPEGVTVTGGKLVLRIN